MLSLFEGVMQSVVLLLTVLLSIGLLSLCGGAALAATLRMRELRWTWGVLGLLPALLFGYVSVWLALLGLGVCVVGCTAGVIWQAHDVAAGGDLAEAAHGRLGLLEAARRAADGWQESHRPRAWLHGNWLRIGRDARGASVSIPAGGKSGSHALILGATGSGKTCGQAWVAARLIEHGNGAVAIDPKGDELLREELERAARAADVPFWQWSPAGPCAYNPYAHGTATEIADRALAGETFTEPHYLRQAQRYLGHAVRAMHAADLEVTAASLMAHMNTEQLEQTAKRLPEEHQSALHEYLDSLTTGQRNGLTGVRDRLSILAESDLALWLQPDEERHAIDLEQEVRAKAVVYFSLEADRRPLAAKMLAGAIVGDLIALAAHLQRDPVETVVLIDEFSGIAAEQVSRLFARSRSAGMSLLLATQELADLRAAGQEALRDQVLGNVEAVIAYRQNVPESAELIAAVAGTRPTWVTTQRTVSALLGHAIAGGGTRTREHQQVVHPSRIKQLRTGQAVVIAPGSTQPPVIAQIHHPREAASG